MSVFKEMFLSTRAAAAAATQESETESTGADPAIGARATVRPSQWRSMRLKGSLYALGAAAALALLLTLPAAPASADCGSLTQGSYDYDSDTFTPGTAATDIDYMVDCADDDGDSLTEFGVDQIPANLTTDSYVVVNVGGTHAFAEYDAASFRYVLKVSGIDTNEALRQGIQVYTPDGNSLWVEVHGSVTTRGAGSEGVNVWVGGSGAGTSTAINRGTINTHGDVDTSGSSDRRAHGLLAGSDTGGASVTNYGHVETRGNAADGILAYAATDGTATAINHGTAIVRGGVHERVNQAGVGASNVGDPDTTIAVQAYSEGGGAHAVNRGTVEAHGEGSKGVEAATGGYLQTGGTGTSVAENFGTVTSTGGFYEVTNSNNQYHGDIREPVGVAAFSQGAGDARAVNHEGGMITTTGDGAPGLYTWSGYDGTGNVTAINRGTIVTRGNRFVTQVRGWEFGAYGIRAQSEHADATAENTGTVNTYGTRAHGVYAKAEVGTATVTNSGNITTHNTVAPSDNFFAYGAYGIWAVASGGSAEATNEASGSITTKGPVGFGIVAETQNDGSSTGASATAVNRGTVTTEGDYARRCHGCRDWKRGLREPIPMCSSRATRRRRHHHNTWETESDGLVAWNQRVGASGTGLWLRAGGKPRHDHEFRRLRHFRRRGQRAPMPACAALRFSAFDPTVEITDAGDATVVNTGTVTVIGAGAPPASGPPRSAPVTPPST